MKLYIKNMVCDRCVLVVENILGDLAIKPLSVSMGVVEFAESELTAQKIIEIKQAIEPVGFEIIEDKKHRLIEKLKKHIIELVENAESLQDVKLSEYLSKKMSYEYSYLSNLFSSLEGSTVEQFYIRHKVEKVKELLIYDQLSLTEISYRLGYSSLAHLSGQFKKITGLSPSYFKSLKDERQRKARDKV